MTYLVHKRFSGNDVTSLRARPQDMFYVSWFVLVSPALLRLFRSYWQSCSWTLGNCHCTEQPVPRCSHIKACTGQQCLNTLILSLHSSQTSIAAAVATSPTTTACVMFCTQTQRGPSLQETFVRPSKGSRTCLMIKHCFDPSLWRVLQCMNCTKSLNTLHKLSRQCAHTCTHVGVHAEWHGEKMDSRSEYSPFCGNLQINPKRKGQGSRPISITESADLFKWVKDTLR